MVFIREPIAHRLRAEITPSRADAVATRSALAAINYSCAAGRRRPVSTRVSTRGRRCGGLRAVDPAALRLVSAQ
jgi:hypothetical protein